MDHAVEDRVRTHLTAAITHVLFEVGADGDLPYVGDDLAAIMATAALQPLRAVADAQQYLADNDLLRTG